MTATARKPYDFAMFSLLDSITEAEFAATVIETAHWRGWLTAHFRPARRKDGTWATPLQGDGAGYPDLTLVRGGRVIFAELKTEKGKLAPLQQRWLDALADCAGVETYVWRPRDADAIKAVLA